jgi:uncharacterized membrane protein required for colicin V production
MSLSSFTFIDWIGILVCLIAGMTGYKRGAISSLISFGGFIASFVIAWIFSPVLGQWLLTTGAFNTFAQAINVSALAQAVIAAGAQQTNLLYTYFGEVILQQSLASLTDYITQGIAQSISFGLIVLLVNLGCWILQFIFVFITKMPVIGTINRFLGLVIGCVIGGCLVGSALWVFTMINIYSGGTVALPTYESSEILKNLMPMKIRGCA